MSECALLQLVALGEADAYLIDDPTITFFKQNYKHHTHFSIESMVQKFKGVADFGESINCTISRHGDLIWKCYLEVTLSSIVSADINTYCNRVGFKLLKKVELRIGGKVIDYHYSHWMHIWTELTHNTDMKLLLNKMVGNKADDGQLGSNDNPGTLMIPLLFFYNRNSSLALPLIALQYHDIEIIIEFDTFNNCISDLNVLNNITQGTISNITLWVDYVFLDTDERNQMSKSSHDYLIETVQSQEISIPANKTSSVKLDFNHPTKFLAWALKDNSFISTGGGGDVCYEPIISGNYNSTFVVRSDGYLWGWGSNGNGQLGLGFISETSDPVRITDIGLNEVKSINTGLSFICSFIIKQNGTLWATGYNFNGQLGLGDNNNRSSFTQVGSDTDWQSVSGGQGHTIALKNDGSLWGTGNNFNGQLGLGDNSNRNIFTKIGSDIWLKITIGTSFTTVIRNDNTLWATGLNTSGQLGLGDNTNRNVLTQVINGVLNTWSKISAGTTHIIGLKTDNTLWSWGNNLLGQLGLGNITNYNSPQQVSISTYYLNIYTTNGSSYFLKTDNTVWSTGYNWYGQLGNGSYGINSTTFNQIGSSQWMDVKTSLYTLVLIDNNYNLYFLGSNTYNQFGFNYMGTFPYKYPTLYTDTDTWLSYYISYSTFIVKSNGTLWSSGYNTRGQLGLDDLIIKTELTQVGTDTNWLYVTSSDAYLNTLYASAGIKTDGTLWTWGTNTNGVLGLGNYTSFYTPQKVGTDTNWSKVSIGSQHMLAIKNDGTLWSWGYNSYGQLGTGNYTTRNSLIKIGIATDWSQISCGENSSYAIKTNGTLWATGYNFYGQLGTGNNTTRNTFIQIGTSIWTTISTSYNSVLGIKTDGTLWSWGYNNQGQLGVGNITNYNSPQQIGTSTWTKISNKLGYGSKGIKTDGTLWSWGITTNNSLGTDIISSPQTTPLQVGTDTDWVNVDGGFGSGFAIKNNGTKWIWGLTHQML